MIKTSILAVLLLPLLVLVKSQEAPFPSYFESDLLFQKAIRSAKEKVSPVPIKIHGITLPHHVPATIMSAELLVLLSKNQYDRIVILCPDHFHRGTTPLSTTQRDFRTTRGIINTDTKAAQTFLSYPNTSLSQLFSHEHGIHAILPLLQEFFPNTPILPIAVEARANPKKWPSFFTAVKSVITKETLLIQSTDFSHFLPWEKAKRHDQQTINILTTGNLQDLTTLKKPEHADAPVCQWIQQKIQQEVFHVTAPIIHDNRNVCELGATPDEPRTTSYITQLWTNDALPASALPGKAYFFGGDTFLGRNARHRLQDAKHIDSTTQTITRITGKSPLIVNMEGVFFEQDPPIHAHSLLLGMTASTSFPLLKKWNVTAAVCENNHAYDFGESQKTRSRQLLKNANIRPIQNQPEEMDHFFLSAYTDITNQPAQTTRIIAKDHFIPPPNTVKKPWIVFLHGGKEWQSSPDERMLDLCDMAQKAGAQIIVGCHPHVPSTTWHRQADAICWPSLGNFYFDQKRGAGVLLELRFFSQGTYAARIHALGNLYSALEK